MLLVALALLRGPRHSSVDEIDPLQHCQVAMLQQEGERETEEPQKREYDLGDLKRMSAFNGS